MLKDTEDLHIASAVAAHLQALRHWRKRARGSRVSRRPRYDGSVPGRRPNKRRNFRSGLRAILRDYFGLNGEPPVYDEGDFERRFRVPRGVFLRVYNAVKDRPFFAQRINATGRLQAHPLQKVVAAFRVIVYGEAPDRTDEYARLSASTIAMSVRELMRLTVDEFGPSYLRSPTPEELQRILTRNRRQPRPPHLSRISLHFGCISQTIAFSKASHDRPADVSICESRCMDSLQSNVIRLTGCGGRMYNLIHLFPTSFKP